MSETDLFHHIALQLVPGIGPRHARALIHHFKDPAKIFKAKRSELERINGIGKMRASAILQFRDFNRVEEEIKFINQFNIRPLVHGKSGYPSRLIHCEDAPQILYYKGNADLNTTRMLSIVGTRMPSDYGKRTTRELIGSLSSFHPVIISGLASGIDTIAHDAALKSDLQTIGILAHGLDRIYPNENKSLAKKMIHQGGLLTEFMSLTRPDASNFPMRNRIVAGLADAVIVIETGIKGGSMITADIANSYNKDVFALPGRIHDSKSIGCNYLIRENKASLLTCADEIAEIMNWDIKKTAIAKKQTLLFPELTENEKAVTIVLAENGAVHIDTLSSMTGLKNSELAAILLKLEMYNLINPLPGRHFTLV